jgi:hypothetical protein
MATERRTARRPGNSVVVPKASALSCVLGDKSRRRAEGFGAVLLDAFTAEEGLLREPAHHTGHEEAVAIPHLGSLRRTKP